MTDVGMNLAPVRYYATQFPFLDRMKTANGWSASSGTVAVDDYGNPLAIPTGASAISTIIALDPVSAAPIDVYELTYSGAPATFQIVGANILSTAPGKITFQYTSTASTMANLIIRSMSATDPVHDIHVVRQDEVPAFNSGELFNSAFVDQVSNWQTIRFMDWGATNTTTIRSWDQRALIDDASWAQEGNSASVPIEVMIQLANEARTDMWYNVPTQADDNYVRNALAMIKDRLAPGLKLHLEYSNEVWNTAFQQSQYGQAMANTLWGIDANRDGVIGGSEAITGGNNVYYGFRSAQIAGIANAVFSGTDQDRLETVFATQNGNATLEKYQLDGVAKANVGTMSTLFDELAVTSYFGLEFSGETANDRAKLLGWARSGQVGIDSALQELAHGGAGMDVKYSIDDVARYLAYEKTVADRYGLDLVGYEGGFHGSAAAFGADQATITDFFARLMADPGMKGVYQYWFDTFEKAGGKMLAAFNDVQKPSIYGAFGTLDSLYDAKTPRYQALLAEAAPKAAPAPAPIADPTLYTALASASLDGSHTNLTFTGTGPFVGSGNAQDNVVTGGAGADKLFGYGGNDTLIGGNGLDLLDGGDGADTLDGGGGADRLTGGNGDDTYIVDDKGDVVTENAVTGIDAVRTTLASYTLGINVENLTYIGSADFVGRGNALANVLTGGNGNDNLDGGLGADRMVGGTGNDLYTVNDGGDAVVELAGGGTDTVSTSVNYTLAANVENLTLLAGATAVHGNDLANVIREYVGGTGTFTLYGEGGNDNILGSDAIDIVYGGAGDDLLSAGGGNDVLYGGLGADWLNGGKGADRFAFAPGDADARPSVDMIADFNRADGDRIDLTAFDANKATLAHDPLRFIGSSAFTLHAGELRVAGATFQIDINGDGTADVSGWSSTGALIGSDFLL